MKLLVRADASVEIGMGHRVRCQALIHAFTQLGWQCQFVVDRRYQAFASQQDCFIGGQSEQECKSEFLALARQADLVVLDHYGYSADDIAQLYQHQTNLLVLDDMNDRGEFPAKWLLNPLQQDYSKLVEFSLTGSRYALLRPTFHQQDENQSAPEQLLITLGGTDPLALTLPILNALLVSNFPTKYIQVLLGGNAKNADQVIHFCRVNNIAFEQGLVDVTPLMKQAKMAISAAGGTLFELACMGVPTIFAQVADNQTRSLEQHVPLGWCRSIRFDNVSEYARHQGVELLVEEVNRLWLDIEWQQSARRVARSLVDANGVNRVAKTINSYFSAP
ncbi:MAG: UDP-2,4-diacetamido-2,4,6-trideoxy-beta-L-altropyranose hydrolase [Marinomonas foliarum]|uniref:UDP-2,4-diacetamido-2,4, 6-trideoxy-beta-L-altropyranose hydrolase n=1 Tax=Marinomonas foliarum TaxID=491950 RepID=A0A369ADP0_9GAMM|nr:UDP-2,4-diacetamido-2,4,6-trideoxy-beta-L-altropyranose hydrolase [Marinomonas foliarum]RCX07480.1 UDP-2,4-diacetamido-2,4,6-trideoxy-beta-L-altropyranose hydrolase [Marinomonas foliarum]